jgi:hypothetical protein
MKVAVYIARPSNFTSMQAWDLDENGTKALSRTSTCHTSCHASWVSIPVVYFRTLSNRAHWGVSSPSRGVHRQQEVHVPVLDLLCIHRSISRPETSNQHSTTKREEHSLHVLNLVLLLRCIYAVVTLLMMMGSEPESSKRFPISRRYAHLAGVSRRYPHLAGVWPQLA